ncbi:cation:proton antiporter [Kordiimonas lacus]|uniref:Kef-type K+ transport system, membrane component KefB n=1 Tax=Kordiimonas lacus TaxID=637679 RepID=A0A1G6SZJ9_9PROT|nr:cation:proton antiporter [Kordiimonas lacus]SDD22179.1 Kef-type K+ transport system, membrane component KefB [Kordiimonas lacus]
MNMMLALFVFLLLARLGGHLADRARLPVSVGEMAAGVLVALAASQFGDTFPVLPSIIKDDFLAAAADIAVFFLVLLAGIELEPREIAQASGKALWIALGGVLLPLVGGAWLAWTFLPAGPEHDSQALVTGVVLSITALPVVVKVLTDFNMLRGAAGEMIVTAALFDDIIGLVLIALLLAIVETGGLPGLADLGVMALKVAAFFAVTVLLGVHVYPRVQKGLKLLKASAIEFSALVTAALGYGWLAEAMSLHWVVGAFMAGLYFEKYRVGARSYTEIMALVTTMVQGVLGPLFFLSMGLYVDIGAAADMPWILAGLLAFALLSKIAGAGLPALALGFGVRDALTIGTGMAARGVVGLVVVGIAVDAGVFNGTGENPAGGPLLSALVLVSVLTTALTPLLLQLILKNKQPDG